MERSYFNRKGMKCPYNKKYTFEVNDRLPMPQQHADKREAKFSARRKRHSASTHQGNESVGEAMVLVGSHS